MSQVFIRLADINDFPAIYSLIKQFAVFQKTPEKVIITPAQMVAEKDLFRAFVAVLDNTIVGFATFFPAYYSWSGKAIYLDDLYVLPEHRKQGIGKQLLQAVIQQAQADRCKKVRWQVSQWNQNAIEFYQAMGAVIDNVEMNCDLQL